MSYRIRPITCYRDVRELVAIHNKVWDNSTGIIDLLENGSECFLAVDRKHDAVAGYAFVQEDVKRGHVELNDIAIDPEHRGQGAGLLLMQHIMKRYSPIKLCVRANNKKALQLYRRLGFEQEAVFENYYDVGQDGLRLVWRKDMAAESARPH
ncbi:MAG: GNAT family N-acetyltransferase [Planctomycetota bacterium]